MPEGHVLHREARLQSTKLVDHPLRAESPQGRFTTGAEAVDRQRLITIEARGKHLFYRFENDLTIHVHLGLFGKFRHQQLPFPEPSANARLLLSSDTDRVHLAGPTTCRLLEPDDVDNVLRRLGPDPLCRPVDGASQMASALGRRTVPVGRALLDQRAIAGLGNIYRSELLFLAGLDPFVPANVVSSDDIAKLWDLSVSQLRSDERSGRIVTVDPAVVGKTSRSRLVRDERLYAYKRHGEPCRVCSDTIRTAKIDDRNIWWCPSCQAKN